MPFIDSDSFNVSLFINAFPRIIRSIDAYPLEGNKGRKKFIKNLNFSKGIVTNFEKIFFFSINQIGGFHRQNFYNNRDNIIFPICFFFNLKIVPFDSIYQYFEEKV